jgi:hypothetical protein
MQGPGQQELKQKWKHQVRNGYKEKKEKKKILILGDSHAKYIAKEVQYIVDQDFEMQAIVKPGANNEPIVNMTNSDIARLIKDVCIIW